MNLLTRFSILLLAILCVSCSSSPDVRFYRVAFDQITTKPKKTAQLVVSLENLSASSAYDDVRIVFRKSPYKLDYYHYHRWSAPPSVLVTDALRTHLSASGKFKDVTTSFTADAHVLLSGRLLAFEEVDSSSSVWHARVVLSFDLRSARDGKLLWSETIQKKQKLTHQSPEGLAKGMTLALRSVGDTLQKRILTHAPKITPTKPIVSGKTPESIQ